MELNFQTEKSGFIPLPISLNNVTPFPYARAIDTIEQLGNEKSANSKSFSCWKVITSSFNKISQLFYWVFKKVFCCFYPKNLNTQEVAKIIKKLISHAEKKELDKTSQYMKLFNSLPSSAQRELKELVILAIEDYLDTELQPPFNADNREEWKKQNAYFLDKTAEALVVNYTEDSALTILKAYLKRLLSN